MTSEKAQDKDRIRKEAKRFRDQLNVSPDWSTQATEVFFESVQISPQKNVSVYYPIGKEIDTSPLVEQLWQRGVTVCLPVIREGERKLDFVRWDRQTKLIAAGFGLQEPEDKTALVTPDILIIPLLAFDQRGNRMGYGQGHYDETLKDLRARKDVLAIGLAYAEQAVLLALPTEPHDQKLDMVITPQRVFDFRG